MVNTKIGGVLWVPGPRFSAEAHPEVPRVEAYPDVSGHLWPVDGGCCRPYLSSDAAVRLLLQETSQSPEGAINAPSP